MNPKSTLDLRTLTAFAAIGWATLSIVLSLAALVSGSGSLDTTTAVGVPLGGSSAEIGPESTGEPARLGAGSGLPLLPGATERDALSVPLQVLLLCLAALYVVTGAVVWWMRPGRTGAWALLLFCSTLAVQISLAIGSGEMFGARWRLAINLPLVGATAFHLFTSYPIEPVWLVRQPRAQVIPYLAAGGLVVLALVEGPLGLPPAVPWASSLFFTLVMVLASLTILAVERRRHGAGPMKSVADVVLIAALVSFAPVLVLLFLQWALAEPFPYALSLVSVFVFPLVAGFGIVRRQLFDLRNVARSSAAYGAATLGITGVFALVITSADTLVARLGVGERPAQLALLFVALLLFDPVRRRMQALVDRFFDRDRAAYRVAVREISEAMVSMLSLNEISDRILLALTDTMGVERAMVLLADEEGRALRAIASRGDWDQAAQSLEIPSYHPVWKQLWMRREDLTRADFDDEPDVEIRESCRDVFDTFEVELLVPILYGVDLLGAIAVGRKLTLDRLGVDDRLLLRTLANQSSIAIENAKAFDEIAKLNETLEARVEERTLELRETQAQLTQAEKMKSLGQLVAGVAHELNNPIGFVHANLQLLDEQIAKLVAGQRNEEDTRRVQDAIGKLLERSREGTTRVKKIVQDLRSFSRMDQADLQDADLHEEIDRTLRLMEPRFKDDIRVETDFGDFPRVRCYPGQLNQVFMNLLMNACDAIGSDGTIRIRTRPVPGGVRLEFADDGPGIPEDVKSRIFDPFFTTKPVGVGTGLGLSLSHGLIERHGGRIEAISEPGQGTRFVIELPLVAAPTDASAV